MTRSSLVFEESAALGLALQEAYLQGFTGGIASDVTSLKDSILKLYQLAVELQELE